MSSNFFDKIKQSVEIDFICEFNETNEPINPVIFERIYENVAWVLNQRIFIGGISIFNSNGDDVMTISLNDRVNEDFKTVSEIVSQMNPSVFFSALPPEVEADGLGHMKFDYFEIMFVPIIPPYSISFFIIDTHEDMYEIMEMIVQLVRKIFIQTPEEEKNVEKKSRVPAPSVTSSKKSKVPVPEIQQPEITSSNQRRTPVPVNTENENSENKTEELQTISQNQQNTGLESLKKRMSSLEEESEKPAPSLPQQTSTTPRRKTRAELKSDLMTKLAQLKD